MIPYRARYLGGCAVALAICGCDPSPRASGNATRVEVGRVILDTLDRAASEVIFAFADSIDLRPTLLRVSRTPHWWLIDQWTQRVAQLDAETGHMRWVTGREGGGPQEFGNIRDAALLGDSLLAVLDPGLGRITLLDRGGRAVDHVSLSAPGNYQQLVGMPDGTMILHVSGASGEGPLIRVSPDGEVLQSIEVPWARYHELHPMSAQLALGGNAQGAWIAAMLTGPRFFRFRNGEALPGAAEFIEAVEPPTVTMHTNGDRTVSRLNMVHRAAARAIVAESLAVVLFEGAGPNAGRLLDLYAIRDGSYLGSLLLGDVAHDIQYASGVLYAFHQVPRPRVVTYPVREALDRAAARGAGSGSAQPLQQPGMN